MNRRKTEEEKAATKIKWREKNKDGYLIDIWKRFEMKKFNQEPELN